MSNSFRTLECSDFLPGTGGLQFATVKSAALRRRADVAFWVAQAADAATDPPIVVLLHGVYGSHWAWALKGAAHLTAARLIAAGELPPVVLMMPSDGLWGDGSGYVPHADHDAERWIIDEVPLLARELVPACTVRSPLMVAGLSMGGFGALRLGGKYRRRIAAAAGLSSLTDAAQFDGLLAESRDGWSTAAVDASVLAALTAASGPLPPLWFECGTDDPYLEANRRLHLALQQAGIAHHYGESPGNHDWPYWSAALAPALRWFGRILRARQEAA